MDWTPKLEVGNLDQWGRLVKSWATGLDYINQGYADQPPRKERADGSTFTPPSNPAAGGNPRPLPATTTEIPPEATWALPAMQSVAVKFGATSIALPKAVAITKDEFVKRLGAAGVKITTMPDQYQYVIIVQGDVHTMVLRLPPKDTLQGSEDDLLINKRPYPFSTFYSEYYNKMTPTPPTDHADIMELHANRIGEYTLNNCN
jgi:hypothetical protein